MGIDSESLSLFLSVSVSVGYVEVSGEERCSSRKETEMKK